MCLSPITLSFDYFGGGPGLSGVSELSVDRKGEQLRVRFCCDRTNKSCRRKTIATLKSENDWRSVLTKINDSSSYAYYTDGDTSMEFPWPHLLQFDGPSNHATDLLACMWAGPPVSEIAESFAYASDEQLSKLHNRVGTFRSARFVKRALRLAEFSDEWGLSLTDLVRRSTGGLDLSAMRRDVQSYSRVAAVEDRANLAHKKWCIAPFKVEIEQIVDSWKYQNPAHSGTTQMGQNVKGSTLRWYLEDYVTRECALPTGKHTLEVTAFSNPFTFRVNFNDHLHGRA